MSAVKFRLVSDGKRTYAEICGKTIGSGVDAILYSHNENGISVNINIHNLNDFRFMDDTSFDEIEQKLLLHEPSSEKIKERLE